MSDTSTFTETLLCFPDTAATGHRQTSLTIFIWGRICLPLFCLLIQSFIHLLLYTLSLSHFAILTAQIPVFWLTANTLEKQDFQQIPLSLSITTKSLFIIPSYLTWMNCCSCRKKLPSPVGFGIGRIPPSWPIIAWHRASSHPGVSPPQARGTQLLLAPSPSQPILSVFLGLSFFILDLSLSPLQLPPK